MTSLPKVVSIDDLRRLRAQRADGKSPGERRAGNALPATPPVPAADDRAAEMSESAADERARLMAEMREALDDLPDVRMDKVIEARQRIATGFYDKERVRLDILTALLGEESGNDLGLPPKMRSDVSPRKPQGSKEPSDPSSSGPSKKNGATKRPSKK